jgi:hypothetical protein
VFSESNSKVYTNFESCGGKNDKRFKNILIYKAQQIMMTSKIPRNVYIFLDDGASGVQVRDIE